MPAPRPNPAAYPDPVRVVTWNLQGAHLADLPGVAARLRELAPDVVCLQEVQRRQFRGLRRVVGPFGLWSFKHWPVRTPAEGLGIAARAPIVRNRAFTVSRGEPWWSWRRRIAQAVVVERDGTLLRIVNTHLGAFVDDDARAHQARRIMTIARDLHVVAGDLNVRPESGVLAEFLPLRDAWSVLHARAPSPSTNWPAGPRVAPPSQRLDYVCVAPSLRVLDVQIPTDWERWAPLSDHLPVIVDLEAGTDDDQDRDRDDRASHDRSASG
jgi:endonuclease/exonuclease/phosphatase family metal-dependent hydrolase